MEKNFIHNIIIYTYINFVSYMYIFIHEMIRENKLSFISFTCVS